MRKMRTNRMRTYVAALAVATVAAGVPAVTAHAEEIATDTDAAAASAKEAQADLPGEEVSTDEVTVEAKDTPYYNISINGGTFDGTYYRLGGQVIASAFFCDGTYTYYLQADGAAMKDKLTYHPDGEHVIYFDSQGHEVFSNFAEVKQSISGEAVNDLCFFDVYGYMYVNKLTYNQEGTKLYYVNEYGVIERNGWFQFPNRIEGLTTGVYEYVSSNGYDDLYGYGQSDGSLLTNMWTFNWNDQAVYLQGNGTTVKGLAYIDSAWRLFDGNDGHLLQSTAVMPDSYTMTIYGNSNAVMIGDYNYAVVVGNISEVRKYLYMDEECYGVDILEFDSEGRLTRDTLCLYGESPSAYTEKCDYGYVRSSEEYEYYNDGKMKSKKIKAYTAGEYWYNDDTYYPSGNLAYSCSYWGSMANGYVEWYYRDAPNKCTTGYRNVDFYNDPATGAVTGTALYEEAAYHENGKVYTDNFTRYDESGNVTEHYVRTYDLDGNLISEVTQ